MFIKPCLEPPPLLLTEEALLRRLLSNHPKREDVIASIQKRWSGYRGEQNLSYHLEFLPEKEYLIFHNIRLVMGKRTCQIDFLVLTPFAMFIIESKNLAGQLFYDQNVKRLIRIYQNQEESFPDPIMQARRQQILLKRWLEDHKVRECPIPFLISIGPSAASFKTNGSHEIFQKILYAEQIPYKIEQLNQLYSERIFSPYLLQKISDLLMESHTPPTIDILEKYGISRSDIISGVQCPLCSSSPMMRTKNNWYCHPCKKSSPNAHYQAIKDYLLIYGAITNHRAREFLYLSSTNVCTRLLEKMDLSCTGKRKYKVYALKNE